MSLPAEKHENSDLDYDTDALIDSCDGDARAAVMALLVANSYLEQEIVQLKALLSSGYQRGRVARAPGRPEKA